MNRKSYPSDLSEVEWQQIERLLPREKPGGHPRTVHLREILNNNSLSDDISTAQARLIKNTAEAAINSNSWSRVFSK